MFERIEEAPLCASEAEVEIPSQGARLGHRYLGYLIVAPFAVAMVFGAAFVVDWRPHGHGSSSTVASIGDAIAESSYVQTRSYKCNMKHEEALSQCESPANQTNTTGDRRLAEATSVAPSLEICREGAYLDYKACCGAMPSKRCSFPCSEVCQQKFGIMTSNYTECCSVCPGGKCVDPWRLLDEFW